MSASEHVDDEEDDVVFISTEKAKYFAQVLRRVLKTRPGSIGAVEGAAIRDLVHELDPVIPVEDTTTTVIPVQVIAAKVHGANGDGSHRYMGAVVGGDGSVNVIPMSVVPAGSSPKHEICSGMAPVGGVTCLLPMGHDGDHEGLSGLKWP